MLFDLHCHSTFSDGALSPELLVSRAARCGVSTLALTDHDTTDGVCRAKEQCQKEGINLINGVEFSSVWRGHGVHIVGLDLDIEHPPLQVFLARQHALREERAQRIALHLENKGIPGALDGVRKLTPHAIIGRPHFAKFLLEKAYVKNVKQAFSRYLNAAKLGDLNGIWPTFDEVVDVILTAGGSAVLAHPAKYGLTRTKLSAMLSDFKSVGGQALELISGKQKSNVTNNLAQLVRQHDLLVSCGSDFHAPGQAWQELGAFGSLPPDVTPIWDSWS